MCVAVPAELLAVHDDGGLRRGQVRVGGAEQDVSLECLPDAAPGQFVLVHLGCAIARLDPEDAARRLALLDELAALLDGDAPA